MKNVLLVLFVLGFHVSARADDITLLFIKSPGINWSSPKALASSTFSSFDEPFGLGHVNILVNCQNRSIETGIFNRWKNDTRNAVLLEGNGLGVLFRLFEGHIQKPKKILDEFGKMVKLKRANFLRFLISSETCERLLNYHDEYAALESARQKLPRKKGELVGPHQQIYYGFPAIPRSGEGGGCSGFAMGYLEVAGLKESWMEAAWSQYLLIPEKTVGRPLRDDKVSMLSLLRNGPKTWATHTEPHFPLFFWDPDRMFDYVEKSLTSAEFEANEFQGARGITLDRRSTMTPTGSIFLSDILVAPTDPTRVYRDFQELIRRFGVVRE